MRRAYGGVAIDLDAWAIVFDHQASIPVFHAQGKAWSRTRCGIDRLVPTFSKPQGIALPPKHAVKFARPCARCWPELRRQLAIPRARPAQGEQARLPEEAK